MAGETASRSRTTAYMDTAMQRSIAGSLYMPADQKTMPGKNAMRTATRLATSGPNRRVASACMTTTVRAPIVPLRNCTRSWLRPKTK